MKQFIEQTNQKALRHRAGDIQEFSNSEKAVLLAEGGLSVPFILGTGGATLLLGTTTALFTPVFIGEIVGLTGFMEGSHIAIMAEQAGDTERQYLGRAIQYTGAGIMGLFAMHTAIGVGTGYLAYQSGKATFQATEYTKNGVTGLILMLGEDGRVMDTLRVSTEALDEWWSKKEGMAYGHGTSTFEEGKGLLEIKRDAAFALLKRVYNTDYTNEERKKEEDMGYVCQASEHYRDIANNLGMSDFLFVKHTAEKIDREAHRVLQKHAPERLNQEVGVAW